MIIIIYWVAFLSNSTAYAYSTKAGSASTLYRSMFESPSLKITHNKRPSSSLEKKLFTK